MASDLSGGPRTGLHAQLCGDAHLSNFGAFMAPDRDLVFSVNDFDETLPGPFEWDVKRLVASFAVAARDRGFDDKERETICLTAAKAYREAMRALLEDAHPRPLVRPCRRRAVRGGLPQAGEPEGGEDVRQERREGANEGQPARIRQAHRARRRRAEDRQRPAVDRSGRGRRGAMEAAQIDQTMRTIIRSYRRTLAGRPAAPARALPLRPRRAEGGRRGKRRHACLDRAHARSRRAGPALPPGEGGGAIGARAVPRAGASSRPAANASSRASG